MTPEELDRVRHQIEVMDTVGNVCFWIAIIGLALLTPLYLWQIWLDWRR